MLGFLGGLLSVVGSVFNGIFGFKKEQSEVVKQAIGVLSDLSKSDDARATAAAAVIAAEANSDSWITRSWRPLTVIGFVLILFSFFFGHVPQNVTPDMMNRIFDIVEYSILGYGGVRSVDRWVTAFLNNKMLVNFIQKKIL